MLDWSLVIATLNRHDVLKQALTTAVRQSRAPRQIIIVDASAEFAAHRDDVMQGFAASHPGIEWIYLPSAERSLTHQRNIGLARVTSHVAFFFDDDTFLFDGCAEAVMAVYEQDKAQEVGGVSALLSPFSPLEQPAAAVEQESGKPSPWQRARWRFAELLASPWDQHRLFIPYDAAFHRREPTILKTESDLSPLILFHGCRMTFRTEILRRAGGFEEVLTRHGFGEDIDASYRVSRSHALLLTGRAQVFHAMAPTSRARRKSQATLVILNAVVLFRLHRAAGVPEKRRVWGFALWRAMVELLRDCLAPARGFVNFRGAWDAVRALPALLRLPLPQLRKSYPAFQQRLIDGGR
jgi:GT2 family glycosyltransferase